MEILQISPKVPPAIDGIADYAFTLASGLEQQQIHTHFMAFPSERNAAAANRFPTVSLPVDDPSAFVAAVPASVQKVILHYSDYPYDPTFGAPFWLVRALRVLKHQRSLPLLVMFHEFPSFYLLKKTFYRFPWQRSVAWQLAALADVVITNNAVTKTLLAKRLSQPIINLPVFSNIGELAQPAPLAQRQRRLVVFGTPGRRARIYQRSQAMLIHSCQRLGIAEICDIGASLHLNEPAIAGVRLVEMGEQPAAVVSRLMADSMAGIVYSTDNSRLTKSGVFATYCAHGLVPIVTEASSPMSDGLQAGTHFLFAGEQSSVPDDNYFQTIARAAHQWYSCHNQANTVECFLKALKTDD